MVEAFNVDGKAECGQLNLTHLARNKNIRKKLKQTNAIAHLVQSKSKTRECRMHQMFFRLWLSPNPHEEAYVLDHVFGWEWAHHIHSPFTP